MEPTNRRLVTCHKEGEEGTIELDYDTGQIVTPSPLRPDWADGLLNALFFERTQFYTSRLGPKVPEAIMMPEAFAMQDLKWAVQSGEDEPVGELSADPEFRMEVLATALGISREEIGANDLDKARGEVEIAMQDHVTAEDYKLIDGEMRRTLTPEQSAAKQAEQEETERKSASM